MSVQLADSDRTPLRLGALVALATLAIALVTGLATVVDADHVAAAFGAGFGIALLLFLSGATIACGLACLARRRLELVSLASIAVTGVALDLFLVAVWLDIESEAYGKTVAIGLALSFFALLALGLTLAVDAPRMPAQALYLAALATTAIAALVTTYLIATLGGDDVVAAEVPVGGDFGVVPVAGGDSELLRVLGVALVVLAALWFGTIAASRLEATSARGESAAPAD